MFKKKLFSLLILLLIGSIPACQLIQSPEPTPEPTPTPLPLKELTICLGYEPQSLYPLAASSQAARDVLQAIYDGPIDIVNGQPVPVILEGLPGQAGGLTTTPLEVKAGDEVVNTAGHPVSLRAGTRVFPSGCSTAGCAITWDGITPLQLDQLSAVFRLKAGLSWSDGQPLSAADSVYGYHLAADPATPVSKLALEQTAAYRALDEVSVEWVGKPGLVTDALEQYFWMPLPEHAWGEYNARELLEAEEASRRPLGWGAYEVVEWLPGEEIRLRKNPFYFRAGEGLPYYDLINFKIIKFNSADEVINISPQECDIITPSAADPRVINAVGEDVLTSNYQLLLKSTPRVEVLAFGITPASYDNRYYPYGEDRPDIFGDVRVRQAFAHCMDRVKIANELDNNLVVVADSYLHADHWLMDGLQLPIYGYDPERGRALLEEAGWLDYDQNPGTPRTSFGTARIPPGTALLAELYTSEAGLRADTAAQIAADLAACGIGVNVTSLPARDLYLPAPQGVVFGRNFDLALMSWEVGHQFECEWFMTKEIPKEANNWMGELTGGWNFFGYSSAEFDAACGLYANSGSDAAVMRAESGRMLQLLSADLPVIPLFHYADPYLVKKGMCGLVFSLEADSVFMMIEIITEGDIC